MLEDRAGGGCDGKITGGDDDGVLGVYAVDGRVICCVGCG